MLYHNTEPYNLYSHPFNKTVPMSSIYFSSFLTLSLFYLYLFFVISDQRLRELIYTLKERVI